MWHIAYYMEIYIDIFTGNDKLLKIMLAQHYKYNFIIEINGP